MQNSIVKKVLILACSFILTTYYSQCKKLNILIMIDEEPCLTVNNFYINIPPSTEKIEFKYTVGSVDISDNFYTSLLNTSSQNINIGFEAIIPNKVFVSKYLVNLPKVYLNQEYVIINIFNLDKKKYRKRFSKIAKNDKYYVIIKSPSSMRFD